MKTTLFGALILAGGLCAQVKTEVPPPVPGAKPVTVERIKIHGVALEGTLHDFALAENTSPGFPDAVTRIPAHRAADRPLRRLRTGQRRAGLPLT